jgi:hypothetical protein
LLGADIARAEKPVLENIYPAGGSIGSTNIITLDGKFEPWPPKFWSDTDELSFLAETNKGKVMVRICKNAQPGPHLVRVFNDESASDPAIFVIGSGREITEVEPNNLFRKNEPIEDFPVTINGKLQKRGDVDAFSFKLEAGQWLDAVLQSYVLRSSLDPVLRLVDADGHELAMNHDWATLDPRLVWRAPQAQSVVLQVFGFAYPANSEIQLAGGEGAIYRLRLDRARELPEDLRKKANESEPNDARDKACPIEPGKTIIGLISSPDDQDVFTFEGKKDQFYEFKVAATSLGSPLDAWLSLQDGTGKELAHDDDSANSADPRLEWKAPADGKFHVVIGSLTHRGGPEYRYHLACQKLAPGYEATASANSFVFTAGSTNSVKFSFKRLRGFTNQLVATLEPLPEGTKCEPLTLPSKDGDVELKMVVSTNAPAFNAPVAIRVEDQPAKTASTVRFEFVSRTENNGVPGGYTTLLIDKTDQLWLTIVPKAPVKKSE